MFKKIFFLSLFLILSLPVHAGMLKWFATLTATVQPVTYKTEGFKCPKDDVKCAEDLQRLAHEAVKLRDEVRKNSGQIVKEVIANSKLKDFDNLFENPLPSEREYHLPYKNIRFGHNMTCFVNSDLIENLQDGTHYWHGYACCNKYKISPQEYPHLTAAVLKAGGHADVTVYENNKYYLGWLYLHGDPIRGHDIVLRHGAPLITLAHHQALNAYKKRTVNSQQELNAELKKIFDENPQEFEPAAPTIFQKMQNFFKRFTRQTYWWEKPAGNLPKPTGQFVSPYELIDSQPELKEQLRRAFAVHPDPKAQHVLIGSKKAEINLQDNSPKTPLDDKKR